MPQEPHHTNHTPDADKVEAWKARFLAKLSETGSVLKASRAIKKNRSYIYSCRRADPAFAENWLLALEEWGDIAEDELHRRAIKGVLKPVYQQAKRVGFVREYSDALLLAAVKAAKPDKYRERVENRQTGPGGGPLQHEHTHRIDPKSLSDEQLFTLRTTLRAAAGSGSTPVGSRNGGGETEPA